MKQQTPHTINTFHTLTDAIMKQQTESSAKQNVVCSEMTLLLLLTGSSPALPAQTSEGAEVLAGGSHPVNKKQRRSLQRWARAIGYPSSTGPQDDPSPSYIRQRLKKTAHLTHWSHLNRRIAGKAFRFCFCRTLKMPFFLNATTMFDT